MKEIYERTKQIKLLILDVLEEKITRDTSTEDMLTIAETVGKIEEDKNTYAKMIEALSNNKFSSGYANTENLYIESTENNKV